MIFAASWRRPRVSLRSYHLSVLVALLAAGCAPRLTPLPGTSVPAVALPRAELAPGSQRIVFRWELEDPDMVARGDGAARVTAPDSVRLDFFLAGGLASGAAVLIGQELRVPSTAAAVSRRLVPPPPMLWATLGRLAVPVMRDTVVRVDGDTLRADIGAPIAWRVTFVRDTLRRIERVDGARVVEWVQRLPDGRLRYRHEVNRRQLDLTITRTDRISGFDSAIWDLP
jgi:hypothetical protein